MAAQRALLHNDVVWRTPRHERHVQRTDLRNPITLLKASMPALSSETMLLLLSAFPSCRSGCSRPNWLHRQDPGVAVQIAANQGLNLRNVHGNPC